MQKGAQPAFVTGDELPPRIGIAFADRFDQKAVAFVRHTDSLRKTAAVLQSYGNWHVGLTRAFRGHPLLGSGQAGGAIDPSAGSGAIPGSRSACIFEGEIWQGRQCLSRHSAPVGSSRVRRFVVREIVESRGPARRAVSRTRRA